MPEDFEAQFDLETLVRAKEIGKDAGRMERARQFAEKKREEFSDLAADFPKTRSRSFNGAVRNSKMVGSR